VDLGEGFGEVIGRGLSGGQGLSTGLDRDSAVAARSTHEFLDAPTGLGLNPLGYGQGGEHDRQVGVDGVAGAVVDRLCRCLDYADDRVIGAGQRSGTADGVGIAFGSGFFFS
jgi:hypothetical protein